MNQTEKEYRMKPLINASTLKMYLGDYDPAIAKHIVLHGRPKSSAMSLGSVVHDLLENDFAMSFKFVISPYSDFRKKEAREWKQEAQEAGQEVITQAIYDEARDMAQSVADHAPAWVMDRELCTYEKPIYTPEFKALFDVISSDGRGADFKTTSATSAKGFERECLKYGYYLQGSFYSYVGELKEFWFVAVSTHKPYPVWNFKMSDEALAFGHEQWRKAYEAMHQPLDHSPIDLHAPSWWDGASEETAEECFEL